MSDENAAEIFRLRDRLHDLDARTIGLEWISRNHADGLGELRDQLRTLELELEALTRTVEALTHADDVAKAVTEALRQERAQFLSWPRKLAAGLLALLVAVPSLHELANWLHWF